MNESRVIAVEYLGDRSLKITFSDHQVRELDLSPMLVGVLQSIDNDDFFAQVCVNPETKTLAWPNGIDLDPDVLAGRHAPASGQQPTVLADYRLEASG